MKIDEDDIVPGPDDEPTAAERAHAKTFGELVGKTLTNQPLPPAMSADDRALLEVATVIRAASGGMQLAPSTQRSIVEDALRKAIGGESVTNSAELPKMPSDITPIGKSKRRFVPWAIASASTAIAAAAVVVMMIRAPRVIAVPTARIPMEWTSRPSDTLIGPIDKAQAGNASARIDTIFADRLEGFRDRTLGGLR